MSLLFFDGFDGYVSADDPENYGGWSTASVISSISTSVRSGSGKSALLSSTTNKLLYILDDQSSKTIVVGFAFKLIVGSGSGSILAIQNTASSSGTVSQLTLYLNGSNLIEIRRGDTTGTLLATGTTTLVDDVWYYLEFKTLINNTTGTVELKLNEVVEIAEVTGIDTQNEADDSTLAILIGYNLAVSQPKIYVDDFYTLNSDGTRLNDYLGDVRCEILTPNSDDTPNDWARTGGGTNNYEAIDEAIGAPDDDTTYLSTATVTDKEEFGLPSMSAATTVHAVKVVSRAEKDDAGARGMTHGVTTGANVNTNSLVLGVGYGNFIDVFEDQGDGVPTAWDETAVNAAVLTLELTS